MASTEEKPEKTEEKVTEKEAEKPKEETSDTKDENEEEAADSERIRGGGKVSDRGGSGRSGRRHAPYARGKEGAGSDESQGRRVYVGNLSWDVSWQDLKDHMKTTGCDVVRANVMTTYDGRSKGCGIVEFGTAEDAKKAVETLNDTELNGRQIFVREDRENAQSGRSNTGGHHHGGGGSRFSSGDKAQGRRVYVGNLSWDVAWQDLKDHMREAGEVVHAEVITEPNGRSKGCGVVEYETEEEAQEAVTKLTDTELKGRMIFVREDRENSSGGFYHGGGGGGGGSRQGGTSVYVWNLAYETSWQDLKDHMRAAGNVDQATILTGSDGRSIGCAVVVYQRPQEASRAIRELQNSELNGRQINVREDRSPGGGGRGSHRGGGGGGGAGGAGTQLFVGNLSYDTTWRELKDFFRKCGDVERVEVMETSDGKKKGFGTVRFYKKQDAETAIRQLNGAELQGRNLEVRLDHKAK